MKKRRYGVKKLSEFADSQPHAVYASMTHGFTSKWAYLTLNPLDQTIRCRLIPKLAGKEAPNDRKTNVRITNKPAGEQFTMSKSITKPLVDQQKTSRTRTTFWGGKNKRKDVNKQNNPQIRLEILCLNLNN